MPEGKLYAMDAEQKLSLNEIYSHIVLLDSNLAGVEIILKENLINYLFANNKEIIEHFIDHLIP